MTCANCGSILEIVDSVVFVEDDEGRALYWEETYECPSCGGRGTMTLDGRTFPHQSICRGVVES